MLISIIIPSAGRRPEFLQRAIKSALMDNEQIKTEIIVVLNGKDGMAFDLSQSFQHPFVKYHKIEQGNVCKARNYGLALAQGDLIRFLDDDDFLYPDVAYRQYLELFHSDAEIGLTWNETLEKYNQCLRTVRRDFSPFQFKLFNFYDKKFYVPHDIETYLIEAYGEDFMIPKKYSYSDRPKEYENLLDISTLGCMQKINH